MGARSIVGLALAFGSVGTLTFVACRGGTPQPVPPAMTSPGVSGTPPFPTSTAVTSAQLDAGEPNATEPNATEPNAADQNAAQRLAQAIEAAQRCEQPVTKITNHPDGGVIFNNALTSKDAGSIDRGRAILDELTRRASTFQCCFDSWLRAHPDKEERVMLQLTLDADGTVTGASIDDKRSSLADEVSLGCVLAVAKGGQFAPSPAGKATTVEYPLVVASR